MMVKFSICNEIFQGWPLDRVFSFVSQLGYDGIELAPFTLANSVTDISKDRRREIANLANEYGLDIVGIHWVLVKPEGLHITHPDRSIRERTEEYLKRLIDFCGDIGAEVIVFGSPKQRSVLPGVRYEDAWNYAKEIFRRCSEYAESFGVYICIEPLSKEETNFINNASEAIRLIEEVDHPNFRLILDVRSMSKEEKSIPDTIRGAKQYLMHFHANDDNGLGPGFGNVDWFSVAKALKEIGYKRYVSVEVFDFSLGPEYIASESLKNLRRFFKNG